MFGLGWGELLIILFIVLLLFGARKLTDLANSLGSSVSAFKKGMRAGTDDDKQDAKTIEGRAATGEAVPASKSESKS